MVLVEVRVSSTQLVLQRSITVYRGPPVLVGTNWW